MNIPLVDIAKLIQAEIEGNSDIRITGAARIEEAQSGEMTFLANPKYEAYLYSSQASAVLVSKDFQPDRQKPLGPSLVRVDDVYSSLSVLLEHFGSALQSSSQPVISERASIAPDVLLGERVAVGDFVTIGSRAEVGAGTRISEQVYIGQNVKIGKDCIIYAGVRLLHDTEIGDRCVIHSNTVVGSDGFGFAPDRDGVYTKIPQIGKVVIGNDVEIGANVAIDRATMGATRIGHGVKIDNLVQIAHNVTVGDHTVIAAQAGIAGSAQVGKHCVIGGQVGVAGHIKIADRTSIQAQSGVQKSTQQNAKLFGSPALDYTNYQRSYIHFKNLSQIVSRIGELEKSLERISDHQK